MAHISASITVQLSSLEEYTSIMERLPNAKNENDECIYLNVTGDEGLLRITFQMDSNFQLS